jgi:hypothetical protein
MVSSRLHPDAVLLMSAPSPVVDVGISPEQRRKMLRLLASAVGTVFLAPGHVLNWLNDREKKRRERQNALIAAGICTLCAAGRAMPDSDYCERCRLDEPI